MTSWGVVATVDDPASLVAAMVYHHLAAGAGEVQLFLDRPNPDLVALLEGRPEIRITLCDEAYWARSPAKQRPIRNHERQLVNNRLAYRRSRMDWLLHCDADEFVLDGARLARDLAAVGPDLEMLRLPNLERAFRRRESQADIFGGDFRRPCALRGLPLWALYGRATPMLRGNVLGYAAGKALSRTGRPLRMGIHHSWRHGGGGKKLQEAWAPTARILHFNAVTRFSWQVKMLRKLRQLQSTEASSFSDRGQAVVRAVGAAAGDPAALDHLTETLLALNGPQRAAMRAVGLLTSVPMDPAAALRRERPDADLSPAAFDAAVRDRNREFLAECGLA